MKRKHHWSELETLGLEEFSFLVQAGEVDLTGYDGTKGRTTADEARGKRSTAPEATRTERIDSPAEAFPFVMLTEDAIEGAFSDAIAEAEAAREAEGDAEEALTAIDEACAEDRKEAEGD